MRLDLPTRLAEESFLRYIDDHPVVIDPATEHTSYLSEMPKWLGDEQIHAKIREFADAVLRAKKRKAKLFSKWRKGQDWLLWNYDMAKDARLRHDVIGSFYDLELAYGSTTLLVPCPLIDDLVDLQTAIELNDIGRVDAEGKDAEFGNYFILSSYAVLDEGLRQQLTDYLARTQVRLNVLKFKFLNLRNATMDMIEAYADFYRRLAEIREQHTQKVFFVLENGYQVYPSAAVAFDLVSTSMTGYDRPPRGSAKKGFGGIFNLSKLAHIKFAKYVQAFKNNGEKPLCDHTICQKVDPRKLTLDGCYRFRRKDYVLCMNDLMSKIPNYIRNHNIEQVRQDITNSFLSPLRELVPTDWEHRTEIIQTP
jgi:hypothetical protein